MLELPAKVEPDAGDIGYQTLAYRKLSGVSIGGKIFKTLGSPHQFIRFDHVDTFDGRDSLTIGHDNLRYTIPLDEVEYVFAFPDGGRVLIDRYGRQFSLEPGLYAGLNKTKVAQYFDAKIAAEKIVEMPKRDKKDIHATSPRP